MSITRDRDDAFATLAKRQRQIAADALAADATRIATEYLESDELTSTEQLAAAAAVLEQYATPYGRLLAAGARPPHRRPTKTGARA